MASTSDLPGAADANRAPIEAISPLGAWYLNRFRRHLPAIRLSELLTTYFAASYGELYEYGSDFIRILHLIDETADQESIRREVRRLGWKWYRLATERDWNVRRDENGKWVRMTKDEVQMVNGTLERIMHERWPERVKEQHDKERSWAAEHLVDITTGRLGEITQVGKSFEQILPCYLFHVRYPNDFGDDLWTAQEFLEGLNDRSEEAVYRICHLLLDLGGRVKTLLRHTEQVLENPDLLRTDIDQRRKTRTVDLKAVDTSSSATSTRIVATAEFLMFLTGMSEDVR